MVYNLEPAIRIMKELFHILWRFVLLLGLHILTITRNEEAGQEVGRYVTVLHGLRIGEREMERLPGNNFHGRYTLEEKIYLLLRILRRCCRSCSSWQSVVVVPHVYRVHFSSR